MTINENTIKTDPENLALPNHIKTVPVESRGGNDMSSGAEDWGQIEDRLTAPEIMNSENLSSRRMAPTKTSRKHTLNAGLTAIFGVALLAGTGYFLLRKREA